MENNSFKSEELLSKSSKFKRFYDSNKISFLSTVIIVFILAISITFYLELQKKKKNEIAENYIKAKILIRNGDNIKAETMLKYIVLEDDNVYSALSLFTILDENLTIDDEEISNLFDHLLENNKFEYEIKNLILYKKALFQSNYLNENKMLEVTKPLINNDTIWKNHTLLLLGDYFLSKNQHSKAKEFYTEIISSKNKSREFHQLARSRLSSINE